MNDEIKEELEEEIDFEFEEEPTETSDEVTEDGEVEFDYDEDGNIVIPDDEEETETTSEEKPEAEPEKTEEPETDDAEEQPEETPVAAPDAKDVEIARLRKQLAERDSQIRDTLKCLGADENEGIAGLEKLAAEAIDKPLDDYRKEKADRFQQEEALRIVQRQKFDEKIRADLAAVHQAYPETKQYKSVYEFPNFAKFSKYRDLGLPPDEAYIAANSKGVMTSVAGAAQQQARNLNNTKSHLRSNVPVGSKDKSITISKKEMSEYRDLFPNMSDKEIVALHKQTMKK